MNHLGGASMAAGNGQLRGRDRPTFNGQIAIDLPNHIRRLVNHLGEALMAAGNGQLNSRFGKYHNDRSSWAIPPMAKMAGPFFLWLHQQDNSFDSQHGCALAVC